MGWYSHRINVIVLEFHVLVDVMLGDYIEVVVNPSGSSEKHVHHWKSRLVTHQEVGPELVDCMNCLEKGINAC